MENDEPIQKFYMKAESIVAKKHWKNKKLNKLPLPDIISFNIFIQLCGPGTKTDIDIEVDVDIDNEIEQVTQM